jgi:penicillin-binding protein 1A
MMTFKHENKKEKSDDFLIEQSKESVVETKKHGFIYHVFRCVHKILSFIEKIYMVCLLLGFVVMVLITGYLLDIIYNLPEIDPYTIQDGLIESSVILNDQGEVIQTLYGDQGIRSNIKYDEIGKDLINAIVAIEDKTFYTHQGFNYIRLVGAVVDAYENGNSIRGTSSITQQLAKNMYLTNERAVERKVKEAYYTILLERTLTKEQILEAYLNKINLGLQTNGVAAAAHQYFSKDAMDLNLIESAIIAGIPKAPSRFAPIKRLRREDVNETHIILDESDDLYTLVFNPVAQSRYNSVIQQMYNNDMISSDTYNEVYDIDISRYLKPNVNKTNEISSYFGDLIKDDVAMALAEKEGITREAAEKLLYERGYIIHSTIDFNMQEKLEAIYRDAMATNKYDDQTLKAILQFQKDHDLTTDGLIGPMTLVVLVQNTDYALEDFAEENYYQYMVHEDMLKINQILIDRGYLTNEGLFPSVVAMFNSEKNIVNDETQKVLMMKYENVINEEHQLIIDQDDYYFDEHDNLILLKDANFEFYQQDNRVQVVVKTLFKYDESSEKPRYIDEKNFTSITGLMIHDGKDVLIDDAYKTKVDGNLVIDRSFFSMYPDFFKMDDDKKLLIDERDYIISSRGEVQPQSAFVVLEQSTGQIKAIVGGREGFGQNIYNRAIVPHQPGSSIKPIGPYTVAIKSREWTAASVIDDIPTYLNKDEPGKRWPINWYEESVFKYRGRKNLRQGVEDSLNVVTAKLANKVGVLPIMEQLIDLGVTTLVEEDKNLAAMALGGMTYGISPLEMTAAYATYANQGVYVEPISFTKVTDKKGNIIIDNIPKKNRVLEEQVAFIIQDMMRTAVTRGYAKKAQIRPNNEGIPIAGKTGTTSDKRDALFIGYSPYYTAAIWFGNDIRLKMDEGSGIAAEFWQLVMAEIHKDLPDKSFVEPDGLVRATIDRVSGKRPSKYSTLDPAGSQIYTEIFLPGTVPTQVDDAHVSVSICVDSGLHATPYCENIEEQIRRVRLDAYDYFLPIADQVYMVPEFCDLPEHQAEDIVIQKLLVAKGDTIVFTRQYNLLMKDGSFVMIPKDSKVDPLTYMITFPSGTTVSGSLYEIQYITRPETQVDAINQMNLE